MDAESLLKLNPHMLLSIINMKLRSEFSDLSLLCEDLNIEPGIIEEKLNSIGYKYHQEINQFIYQE